MEKMNHCYIHLNFEIPVSTGNGICRWNRNFSDNEIFLSEEGGIDN